VDLRIFVEPQQGATYEEQLAVAKATETAGLGGFFRSDHLVAIGPSARRAIGPTDTWLTLAAIARETSRIRLGSLLSSATFRLPGPLAVTVAQVDAMSGGRIELGLGAGWYEAEHLAYAIPFPPLGERFERLREQLSIITGLWATPVGSTFSYAGTHYALHESPALPKPVQSPRPPIIIGGKGRRRTPLLAVTYGDEYNIAFEAVETVKESLENLDRVCDEQSRDPASIVRSVAVTAAVATSRSSVERRIAAIGRSADDLAARGAAGLVEEVAERLAAYAAIGVGRAYLQILDVTDLEHVALIGEQLAPLVAAL
jgi:F420-dependent oxidoreductase-like protein